jgi:hypothetical protein
MEKYTPLVAEFGPEGRLWGINKSSEAAIGVGARSAPLILEIRSKWRVRAAHGRARAAKTHLFIIWILKKCEKKPSAINQIVCTISIFRTLKKYSSSDTLIVENALTKRKYNFPHIWGNPDGTGAKSYMTNGNGLLIIGSPSSCMTLHPIPYEFPYKWGKFCFLF